MENHGKYFLIDGGGNTIMRQLRNANYNWFDVNNIFVTHKHTDHLLGVFWLVRMICQFMNSGDYKNDVYIYSHGEVLNLIRDFAQKILLKKEVQFIDKKLHLVEIADGETLKIIDKNFTKTRRESPLL